MINQEVVGFIKSQLQKGITKEVVSKQLLTGGWNEQDIAEAFEAMASSAPIPQAATAASPTSINNSGISLEKMQIQDTIARVQRHSGSRAFLMVLIVFLLIGGGTVFYFRNNYSAIPIIGQFFPITQQYCDPVPCETTPEIPPTPVIPPVPTIIAAQTALDNFAKVTSFTFTGSETGKLALKFSASTFSGAFNLNSGNNKCLVNHEMATDPNKYNNFSSSLNSEDRIIDGNTYELIKGIGNPTINNKWRQLPTTSATDARYTVSLFHLAYPITTDTNSVCKGQLPTLSLFTVGELIRKSDTEYVFALIPNQDIKTFYSDALHTKSIPGGVQTITGELTVDAQTILPKKITISSSAFPDPEFTFEITAINTPVDIQVPAGVTPVDYKKIQAQAEEEARLKGLDATAQSNISNFRAAAELVFDEQNGYGTVGNDGSCKAPKTGSIFNPSGMSQNVKDLNKMLATIQSSTSMNTACFSTTKAYAISGKMPGTGDYWCADSTGASKKVNAQATSTKCP